MTHEEKINWMAVWAAKNGLQLQLAGEVGFGRECVGITAEDKYPEYEWHNDEYERIDQNGEVWTPEDAYHKGPYVAVLGRGERAESQLFEWLQWFDSNGFTLETGNLKMDPRLGMLGLLLGKNRYARLVRADPAQRTAPSPPAE